MPASRSSTTSRIELLSHTRASRSRPTNDSSRVWTDVILTIKPVYADLIRRREKNHEFRSYKLRPDVKRLWLYESSPVCAIRFVIDTAAPKVPGDLRDPGGIGNDAFDAGNSTRYAYPVRALYKLRKPLMREELKRKYDTTSPQGYCYAGRQIVNALPLNDMERLY